MFYSQFILAKKGPLGTIWIAAHLERKLRKNQVAETNIGVSVDSILFPEVPIALRLSGHLLLGVVRIYSRKVNYLFHDCSEALVKIRQAFHSTVVDLPPEAATAPFHSITLPETFDFDELELLQDPESSFAHANGNFVDHHVTTREQITLQDPMEDNMYLGSSQFGLDERFVDGDSSPMGLDFDEDFFAEKPHSPAATPASPMLKEDILPSTTVDGDNTNRMDIDDYREPSTPMFGLDRIESDDQRVTPMFGSDRIEADDQQNPSSLASLLDPLDEPTMPTASSKVPDPCLPEDLVPAFDVRVTNPPHTMPTTSSKVPDPCLPEDLVPAFNVRMNNTPQILEARTPDLNQEFCPPDEPSTPALPEETSSAIDQEVPVTLGLQESFLPGPAEGFERAAPDEQFSASFLSNQVPVLSPLGLSNQESTAPAHFSMPATNQPFSPFACLQQSNTATMPQQFGMASPPQVTSAVASQHVVSMPQQFSMASPPQVTSAVASQHVASMPQQFSMASPPQVTSAVASQHVAPFLSQSFGINLAPQASSVEAMEESIAGPFQGFPLPASMQQFMAGSSQSSSAGASSHQFSLPATNHHFSIAPPHQPFSNSSANLHHTWASFTANHEPSSAFQQLGLMLNQQVNMAESIQKAPSSMSATNNSANLHHTWGSSSVNYESASAFQQLGMMLNQQVNTAESIQKVAPSMSTTNGLSSTWTSSGLSFSPPAEVPSLLAQIQRMPINTDISRPSNVNQEYPAVREAQELVPTREFSFPAAVQHLVPPTSSTLPFSLPPVSVREEDQRQSTLHMTDVPECENVRSTTEVLREEPDFLVLRKDLSSEKIPALELDRDSDHNMQYNKKIKEMRPPSLEKTPPLREETPYTASKPTPFSTRSLDSLPGDDDVLATILGRGTPAFKVVPTPQENPAPKRPRLAPRTSSKKRKITFDALMVLHGDVIRQQLANTEDIRRVRKKAPCTRREIWALNKESQGQQIFCEPSLPGLSAELHDLYHKVFGVNGAKLPAADVADATRNHSVIEPEMSRLDTGHVTGNSAVGVLPKTSEDNHSNACPPEALFTSEKVLIEEDATCIKREDEAAAEILKGSPNEGEIGASSKEDLCSQIAEAGGAEGQTSIVQEQLPVVSEVEVADEIALPIQGMESKEEIKEAQGSDGNQVHVVESIERQLFEEAVEQAVEKDVEQALEGPATCNSTVVETEGKALEIEVNRESTLEGDVAGIDKQLNVIQPEEDRKIESQSADLDGKSLEVSILDKEVQMQLGEKALDAKESVAERPSVNFNDVEGDIRDGETENVVDVSGKTVDASGDDQEFDFIADARDTEFLAADDDMAYDEVDDYEDDASDELDSMIQDNSGWSARTRNVGRYLKTVFEGMESSSRRSEEQGHPKLGLDRLLIGKTKKEAARMFFETLVLKTKDYIHVEQKNAFEDIHLYPKPKLMKTNF